MLSPLIACYMFLGGAGAGASFVACLLGFAVPRAWLLDHRGRVFPSRPHARLISSVLVASIVVLALGCLALLADLGQPWRVLNLFLHPTPSFISVGTFAISSLLVCDLVLALAWGRMLRGFPLPALRAIQALVLLASITVMAYTGFFLQGVRAVAFWSLTPLIPLLFVASSFTSGLALVVVAACLSGTTRVFANTIHGVAVADMLCALVEILLVVALLGIAYTSGGAARASVESILSGDLGGMFWLGLVLVGILTPLAIQVFASRYALTSVGFTVASMVLVGGFALRVCVIEAGTNPMVMMGVG